MKETGQNVVHISLARHWMAQLDIRGRDADSTVETLMNSLVGIGGRKGSRSTVLFDSASADFHRIGEVVSEHLKHDDSVLLVRVGLPYVTVITGGR
jgi:hypothetical protein